MRNLPVVNIALADRESFLPAQQVCSRFHGTTSKDGRLTKREETVLKPQ
jgi:hypothetical protein